MNTQAARTAIAATLDIIRDGIRDAGQLQRGLLFLALQEHGCTLAQYQEIERHLLADGRVRRNGNRLTVAGR